MNFDNMLWCEKYRPKTIQNVILPESIKNTFQTFVDTKDIPNMILSGSPGSGKTTVAKALCNQLDMEYMFINASEENGIDILRTRIRNFASTTSLTGNKKAVILDEAEYLSVNAQPALRGFMEEFQNNCRFILTCNYKNKIIAPLHSRCTVIDFAIPSSKKASMANEFMIRIKNILKNESVEYSSDESILLLIVKHFPDFRRTINELQKCCSSGVLKINDLQLNLNIQGLLKSLKDKKFNDMRKWVAQNLDNDSHVIFKELYDALTEKMEPQSIPKAVIILSEYQYKSAFVVDQEINTVACFTELMSECIWK